MPETDSPRQTQSLTKGLTLVMAVATGFAVASIYYNQPLLALMARDFNAGAHIGWVATATQLGYALGLLLLVPLGDRMDRRRLILLQTALLTVAMLATSLAPNLAALSAASFGIGIFATIAQQIVPFAAELARPDQRGQAVGAVMSGLLSGILLARTGSGLVAAWFGWRPVFILGAVLSVAMGLVLAWRLPRSRPQTQQTYPALLLSLLHLVRNEPELRRASLTQGCLFASFSAFWTVLALLLQSPRFGLGSDVAGFFGVLALGGVFIAPFAGRLADRRGPEASVRAGAVLVLLAFLVMAGWISLAGLCIGVIILDAGLQLAMISNQAIIFRLHDAARSRVNTVFMTGLFICGAAGSAAASIAWRTGGWPAVMATGATLSVIGLAFQWRGRDRAV